MTTQFVENETYTDEYENTYRKFDKQDYEYQNEIIFGDLKNKVFYTLNVISYDEESVNEETGEITITNFSFVISLHITSKNKNVLVLLGGRWKIENKGFKKNLYLLIQFAHTFFIY